MTMHFSPLPLMPLKKPGPGPALSDQDRLSLMQTYVAQRAQGLVDEGGPLATRLANDMGRQSFENLRALADLKRAVDACDAFAARAAIERMGFDDPAAQAKAMEMQRMLTGHVAGKAITPRRTP